MRFVGSMVLAAFAVFSPKAFATDLTHCPNCDQTSVELLAGRVPQVLGTSEVVVLDYVRDTAWSCTVYRELRFGLGDANCQPASANVQAAFGQISKAVRELKNDVISLPHPTGNIYDVSGCPSCARRWLWENQHSLARQASLLDLLAANGIKFSAGAGIGVGSIQASYEGQTRILVEIENDVGKTEMGKAYCIATITNTEITIDVNQCFDGDANPIPTHQNPSLHTRYTFSNPTNYGGFVGRLAAIGRPIRGPGTVTVGGVIDCSSNDCEGKDKK